MPIVQQADPGCGPQERRWRDRCVDTGLKDDWLERLNALAVFDLISICEGHPDEPEFEHRRTPHINFRVKEIHAETIAALWNSEQATLAALMDKAFLALPLSVVFEVRSGRKLRSGSAADFVLYPEIAYVKRIGEKSRSLSNASSAARNAACRVARCYRRRRLKT